MRAGVLAALLLFWPAAAVAQPPGRWESRAPAPLPRQEAAFAVAGEQMHFVGGFDVLADSPRHEVYDVATDSWSTALPLPEPSHHVQGVAVGDRLFVLGGLQTLQFIPTGSLWEWDGAAWAARAPLPPERSRGAGAAVAHAGLIYYVGGLRGGEVVGEVDVYDPVTDAWMPLADMPTPRDHLGVGVVDGVLYAVGGRQAAFETEVAVTEALDLSTGRWRSGLAPIPTLRAGFAAGVVNGEVIAIGGESPAGAHAEVEAYHPATNGWRSLAPMPAARHGIQGAVSGGGLWMAGGGTDLLVGTTDSLDVFFPPAPPPAPVPGAPPVTAPGPTPLTLTIRRRGRRVIVRLGGVTEPVTVELLNRRGHRIAARRTLAHRVVLRVRRPFRRGRYTVVATRGATVARRSFRVR